MKYFWSLRQIQLTSTPLLKTTTKDDTIEGLMRQRQKFSVCTCQGFNSIWIHSLIFFTINDWESESLVSIRPLSISSHLCKPTWWGDSAMQKKNRDWKCETQYYIHTQKPDELCWWWRWYVMIIAAVVHIYILFL